MITIYKIYSFLINKKKSNRDYLYTLNMKPRKGIKK